MRSLRSTSVVLAAVLPLCTARAGEPPQAAPTPLRVSARATQAMPADFSIATAAVQPFGKRLGDAALSRQRGGTEGTSNAALQGSVSNNQAVNVSTGGNAIGGGAFANAAGVPVVIQNSGNNVLIQSSTIVNVTVK